MGFGNIWASKWDFDRPFHGLSGLSYLTGLPPIFSGLVSLKTLLTEDKTDAAKTKEKG